MKQAPQAWYTELTNFLLGLVFKRVVSDILLYMLSTQPLSIYLIVYVDDFIITGRHAPTLNHFIQQLPNQFALKDLGTLSYFLGVEVIPTTHGLFVTQRQYIIDLLGRLGMTDTKPAPMPMVVTQSLIAASTTLDVPKDYRFVVGGLQYLTLTRPNVTFAVNRQSQYMHSPTTTHWAALKRLIRCLCGTLDKDLTIFRVPPHSSCIFRCRLSR